MAFREKKEEEEEEGQYYYDGRGKLFLWIRPNCSALEILPLLFRLYLSAVVA